MQFNYVLLFKCILITFRYSNAIYIRFIIQMHFNYVSLLITFRYSI